MDIDRPRVNLTYLLTPAAGIQIAEIIFGLIMACLANVRMCQTDPLLLHTDCFPPSHFSASGQGFVVFVGVVCIIFTFFLLIAYLLELQERLYNLPWKSIEIIGSGVAIALYFTAMAVESWYANGFGNGAGYPSRFGVKGHWVAASVFAALSWALYIAGLVLLWLKST